MASTLIRLGLVNKTSHPISVQPSVLFMVLVEKYVLEERVVKIITREIILDLRPKNIKKVFHLRREN